MSNNKQSSVEWLNEKLLEKGILYEYELLEQAKAMHKEEVERAYDQGSDTPWDWDFPVTGVNYYNETYGGNNEQSNKHRLVD